MVFVKDKRGRKLYAHTYFNEPDRRWFMRKFTPAGLFMKKWGKDTPPVDSLMRGRKRIRRSVSTVRSKSGPSRYNASRSRSVKPRTKSFSPKSPRKNKGKGMTVWKPKSAKRFKGFDGGVYGGAVRAKRRQRKLSSDRFNRRGMYTVYESTATVNDINCVYVMNAVIGPASAIEYSIATLLRYLLEKAGIRVTGYEEAITTLVDGFSNNAGYIFLLNGVNRTTGAALSVLSHTVTPTSSLATVTAAFVGRVTDFSAQFGASNTSNTMDLTSMTLYKLGYSVDGDSAIILSQVLLPEIFLEVYAKSELKLQNRTLASVAADDPDADSKDNVASNPLVGRYYTFNGLPKPKHSRYNIGQSTINDQTFGVMDGTGIAGFGGTATSTISPTFREPPSPGLFNNCTGSGKVRMEPGQIKSFFKTYNKKISILNFWRKMSYTTYPGGYFSYTLFPTQMVALEDVINVNVAATIAVAVEANREIGFMVSERKRKFMKTNYKLN